MLSVSKSYQIIYADPPWQYDDKALAGDRGAGCKYDTMSTEDICNFLESNKIHTDDDCFLFLWGTWAFLHDALKVIDSWGFKYKTCAFVWFKESKNGKVFYGMGNYTRANTEYVLLGTKGKPKVLEHSVSQVIKSTIKKHSQKPDIIRNKIVQLCGDLPRLEIFARTKIHGWSTFGNDEKLELQPLEKWN